MDMFQGRAASKRRKMLLFCYSNLRGSEQPTFRLGVRTIAKACDCSVPAAQRFIQYCEERELIVSVGTTPDGKTPLRTFWWFAEGCIEKPIQGVSKTHRKPIQWCIKNQAKTDTHQNTDSKRDSLKNLSLTCYVYGEEKFSVMAVYAFAKRSATAMQKDCTLDYIHETDSDFDLMMRAVIDDLTPEERIASYWENNEGKGERK
jgi:hypothetical protein|nr:MAG TPA: LexA DNA binding domain [Caudoviricetes sp.]